MKLENQNMFSKRKNFKSRRLKISTKRGEIAGNTLLSQLSLLIIRLSHDTTKKQIHKKVKNSSNFTTSLWSGHT